MGNNAAMTVFEAQVIAAHDKGILTLELLDILAEPYRNTDIDSGGMRWLTTKDGKHLYQVVTETIDPDLVVTPYNPVTGDGGWYVAYARITRQRWEMW